MKKQYILLLTSMFFTLLGFAQVSFEKDTTEMIYVDKDVFDYSAKNAIVNNSRNADDTVFIWYRTESIPTGWETAICEDELCHPTSTSTNEFSVGHGKTFDFKFNFYPYGVKDCGSGDIVLVSKMNPSNRDSFHAAICTFDPTASVEEVSTKISIYPNPAKDYIVVNTGNNDEIRVAIYDILGNKYLEETTFSGRRLNIASLNSGVYILKTIGNNTQTKVFNKL